jgi:ligand-binding sensor domain-containing protein
MAGRLVVPALLAAALAACGPVGAAPGDGGGAAVRAGAERHLPAAEAGQGPERPPAEGCVYDRWDSIGVAQGLPSRKVLAILCEPDRVWACTENGLAEIRDGKVARVLGPADGLAHRVVTCCVRSPATGDLWIGTFGGLSRLSGGRITTWRQTSSGLMNDVIYGLEAEGDRVWVATASGLSRYEPARDEWGVFDHTNAVFHEPWIYSVSSGGGRLWIGVWGGGVVAHDPATGSFREYLDPDGEMEVELVKDDGPVSVVTSAVSWSDGALWQSTYFGVARLEGGRWRSWLRKDSPLPSDFVNSVKARGRWAFLATDSGLAVTDGDAWVVYARREDGKGEVRIARPGAPSPEVRVLDTAPAHGFVFQADARGREVWIATADGVSHGVASTGESLLPAPAAGEEKEERR